MWLDQSSGCKLSRPVRRGGKGCGGQGAVWNVFVWGGDIGLRVGAGLSVLAASSGMVTPNSLDKSSRPGSAATPIVALEQEIEEMELEDEKHSQAAKQKVRRGPTHRNCV